MAGTEKSPLTTGYLPFDNSGLRARLSEMPVRAISIEAELRAVMAERQTTDPAPSKRRSSRWQ